MIRYSEPLLKGKQLAAIDMGQRTWLHGQSDTIRMRLPWGDILLLLLLLSRFSRVRFCVMPWTTAYQAPPSMGFSRQQYWSGVPLPSPEGIYYYVTKKSGDPNFLEGEGQALELPASSIRKHVICWLLSRAIELAVSAAQSLGPCLLKEVSQHSDPTQVPDYFELGGLESPRDFTSDIWKSVEREA